MLSVKCNHCCVTETMAEPRIQRCAHCGEEWERMLVSDGLTDAMKSIRIKTPNINAIAKAAKAKGKKFDQGKPALAYLPVRALEQVGAVMTFGAKKYGGFNYLGGLSYTRLLSAAMRHIFSFLQGKDLDEESGLPHWAHAAACLLMLGEMTFIKPAEDDRWKGESNE